MCVYACVSRVRGGHDVCFCFLCVTLFFGRASLLDSVVVAAPQVVFSFFGLIEIFVSRGVFLLIIDNTLSIKI
jgi:hypothetical protein